VNNNGGTGSTGGLGTVVFCRKVLYITRPTGSPGLPASRSYRLLSFSTLPLTHRLVKCSAQPYAQCGRSLIVPSMSCLLMLLVDSSVIELGRRKVIIVDPETSGSLSEKRDCQDYHKVTALSFIYFPVQYRSPRQISLCFSIIHL
jgi:hypothetical protein